MAVAQTVRVEPERFSCTVGRVLGTGRIGDGAPCLREVTVVSYGETTTEGSDGMTLCSRGSGGIRCATVSGHGAILANVVSIQFACRDPIRSTSAAEAPAQRTTVGTCPSVCVCTRTVALVLSPWVMMFGATLGTPAAHRQGEPLVDHGERRFWGAWRSCARNVPK